MTDRKPPVQQFQRQFKIGDDWVIHATTLDNTSDWDLASLVAEFRRGDYATAELVASTNDGTATTGAVAEIDVDGSAFAATGGDLWVTVRHTVTVNITPGDVYLEVSVEAPSLHGRRTIGTFILPVVDQVAVEPP